MINNLHDLYIHQIKDLHSAETQIISALPKMIDRAKSEDLIKALKDHLTETQEQLRRITTILTNHNQTAGSDVCEATKGLIEEGDHLLQELTGEAVDAGIIASCQRVEHYEMAAYGTAKEYADKLDYSDDKDLLDKTLDEESDANEKLTKLATGGWFTSGVNDDAKR